MNHFINEDWTGYVSSIQWRFFVFWFRFFFVLQNLQKDVIKKRLNNEMADFGQR